MSLCMRLLASFRLNNGLDSTPEALANTLLIIRFLVARTSIIALIALVKDIFQLPERRMALY